MEVWVLRFLVLTELTLIPKIDLTLITKTKK